jgi:MYXO-CTERM domain-containing protein
MNLRHGWSGRARWLLAALVAAACGQSDPSSVPFVDDGRGLGGELTVNIATYDDGTTAALYGLRLASGDTIDLVLNEAPTIEPGAYVVVEGARDVEGKIHVTSMREAPVQALRREEPTAANAPLPATKIAVLILDSTYTPDTARKRLLQDVDSARNFYRENTYGAWNIDGDAFGPYSVDTSNCGSRYNQIATDARAAAKAAGVPIESYTQVAYYVPRSGNCGWGGLGSVGKIPSRTAAGPNYGKPARDSWYAGGFGCVVINQELGHNYGLQHGHFCAKGPYTGGCQGYSEYGDPFTPMGTGCGHFTAVEVGELNAFSACNVIDVADGTYQIGPLELGCTGPQVLRWKDPQGARRAEYVHLEYRRKIGHDNTTRLIEGVYAHYGAEFKDPSVVGWQTPANGASDFLVSMAASSKAAILAGQSWTATGGAVFRVVSLGDTATIEVTNSGNSNGATCLDGTPAPESPPTCCATGVCDGDSPDGGTIDAGRPDVGGTGGSGVDAGPRDGRAGAGGTVGDAAVDGNGGGAGGDGGSGGSPSGSGGTPMGGAAGSGLTTGASGNAGGPTSSGAAGMRPRSNAASDAVGGCSCRVHERGEPSAGRAWLWLLALAGFVRRRSRAHRACSYNSSRQVRSTT